MNISLELVDAYKSANYTVLAAKEFILKVGQRSDGLVDLYRRLGVNSSTFITAFNPYSKTLDLKQNTKRNVALKKDLDVIALEVIRGYGQDPEGLWDKEDSFLAFDITKEQAVELGVKYEQNAILWCGADFTPELILLR